MPLILSIETSTATCSVAIHNDGNLIASFAYDDRRAHSRVLSRFVDMILDIAQIDVDTLDAVAVGQGPGSYTGLRVGVSMAKGIAYARHIPLLAINTLEIIAASVDNYPLPVDALRYVLLDARRGCAYGMLLDSKGIIQDTHTCVVSSALLDGLSGKPVYLWGNGVDNYAHVFEGLPDVHIITGKHPVAKYMGQLAYQKLQREELNSFYDVEPIYLRAF